jgi:hypothetical protein
MKPSRVVAACVLSASPFAMAAEVHTGDSLADVRNALGVPRGQAKVDGRQVLYYERGEVELVRDVVTRVALRSPEEQLALDASEARNREERAMRQNQLLAEGTALRDRKMADAHFNDAPLVYQVSYWENFTRSYPGVSVVEPLTIARLRLNEQLDAQRVNNEQAARIADLEDRLAQTESDSYYPAYSSYGYGYYRHPYNPVNLMPIRYDFQNTSAAPYETPHGSPYETPHGSPYTTPTTYPGSPKYGSVIKAPGYIPSPILPSRIGALHEQTFSPDRRRSADQGRDQVAKRDRHLSRNRY